MLSKAFGHSGTKSSLIKKNNCELQVREIKCNKVLDKSELSFTETLSEVDQLPGVKFRLRVLWLTPLLQSHTDIKRALSKYASKISFTLKKCKLLCLNWDSSTVPNEAFRLSIAELIKIFKDRGSICNCINKPLESFKKKKHD